jgi:hypothetical protein
MISISKATGGGDLFFRGCFAKIILSPSHEENDKW